MLKSLLAALSVALAGFSPAQARQAEDAAPDAAAPARLLTVLTAAEPQTQLMALILTRASVQAGAGARILLCDAAGDLALASPPPSATAPQEPRGMTPQGLLTGLMESGVVVEVCAIYLPNSPHTAEDLLAGVGVAAPGPVAAVLLDPNVRLLTF